MKSLPIALRVALSTAVVVAVAGCDSDPQSPPTPFNGSPTATAAVSARARQQLDVAAVFDRPMPTGVAVAADGRVFVCYPRWGDDVAFTVGEVRDGHAVAYPDASVAQYNADDPAHTLVSVQSVVTDGTGRLWILDTGSVNFGPPVAGGAKLVAVDLKTNRVVQTVPFGPDVCGPTAYLNDVRFDLAQGKAGTAYVTDSGDKGPNGIIVVDLASGHCVRRLSGHPSVGAEAGFVATVEGRPLAAKSGGPPTVGSDGIALSPDGRTLYYCAMSGHHLYSVDARALANPKLSDADVAATVKDLGDKGFASDGLICDAHGTLYLTDYEHDAVRVRNADGSYSVLAGDARLLWPDSMSIGPTADDPTGTYLYVTANQLERQSRFRGADQRVRPFVLFRAKVDAGPSHPGAYLARELQAIPSLRPDRPTRS